MKAGMTRRSFTMMALGSGVMMAMGTRMRFRSSNAFEWVSLRDGAAFATGNHTTGGNVLAMGSGAEALMIDAKFAGVVAMLRAEAEERVGTRITTLVNTHHHADHTGGNVGLSADANMIAHAAAMTRVARQADRLVSQFNNAETEMRRLGGGSVPEDVIACLSQLKSRAEQMGAGAFVPQKSIDRYPTTLRVGERRVDLHHFGPGHTDNDVVVHLPEINVVHAGDLVFSGRHPFFDPTGGCSAAGWVRSLRQVRQLCDAQTIVVPGHGPIGAADAVDQQIAYIESLIESVGRAIGEGRSKQEVSGMSWDFMQGLGGEQVRSRAIEAVFDELSR
ncbi:MAG: MBL fold metallo-hydrolase [Phycisphaerales bacterium]|nr:MBL fold metallo-hydrolase [Phycisphaerales bacterium]